jgi:predicted dehydrogenase
MKSTRSFRWGILGTGRIAARFASELPHSHNGVLAATASRNAGSAESFARAHGGDAVTGYGNLLRRDDLDAV